MQLTITAVKKDKLDTRNAVINSTKERIIETKDKKNGKFNQILGGRLFFFFFSSRRRHTRFDCDWSSDVCSSDLADQEGLGPAAQFDGVVCHEPVAPDDEVERTFTLADSALPDDEHPEPEDVHQQDRKSVV